MGKSEKEEIKYRFMCMRNGNTNYSKDFKSKDEAIKYAENLNDDKIEWFGIYEINPLEKYLIRVISKRLQPYKASIAKVSKNSCVKTNKCK
jgi:hypothetical protein